MSGFNSSQRRNVLKRYTGAAAAALKLQTRFAACRPTVLMHQSSSNSNIPAP